MCTNGNYYKRVTNLHVGAWLKDLAITIVKQLCIPAMLY